jgi:hypothetical protein
MSLGSTKPLHEMTTGSLSEGKERPARKAGNLTTVSRLPKKYGSLNVSKSYIPPQSVTKTALPFMILPVNKILTVFIANLYVYILVFTFLTDNFFIYNV